MPRYQRIPGLPLGIEGYRPMPKFASLIRDIYHLLRWIAAH